ncbi:hypothetical protein ACMD2_05919 [Ananas comosus]|uniref:Uncharacterized protein n=1 Tax=Ananas comosus TaxID=4615 RepID=A0A199VG22_ANACO|nr:hypothetical protein ACMD2_05919 [Ananas comosus]
MGEVLAELEEVLRSKPSKDRVSAWEEAVLQSCKARAIRDFTVGACVSSVIVCLQEAYSWTEVQHIGWVCHHVGGMWKFDRSLNACVEQILGLEGSRIQKELASL